MAEQRLGADAKAAFIALLVLALGGAALDVGALGWVIGPICLLLAWFAIFRAPLRSTMLTLMFFALVMENPGEIPAAGQWKSPFFMAGGLLLAHMKSVIGGWIFFSGMDLLLAMTVLVAIMRSRTESKGIGTPKPMIKLAYVTYATIVFSFLIGKMRGGTNQWALWQVDRVMYLPLVFLLCQAAFKNSKDYLAVGKVALAAAVVRAIQAIYVRLTLDATEDAFGESSLPYTTTHNDSMLFAVGATILLALILERAGKKAAKLTYLLLPILLAGMVANDRRIVWVELILIFVTLYLMTEPNAFKRKLNRLMLFAAPVGLAYVAVGWGSQAGIFKPVQIIRSAVDSSADASTAWRDLENFNLIFTLKQYPLTGVGYGNGFWEMWPMPVVDYSLERYVPHNSILGILCYGGYVGYAGITALWVGGIFFCIRAYHFCKQPLERAAALAGMGSILVYYLQCFGDMGLGSWTGVYLVAPSIAIACKLAVANGAWQNASPARKPASAGFAPPEGVGR